MRLDAADLARGCSISRRRRIWQPSMSARRGCRFAMADMDMGTTEIDVAVDQPRALPARGQFFTMAGNWSIEATLRAMARCRYRCRSRWRSLRPARPAAPPTRLRTTRKPSWLARSSISPTACPATARPQRRWPSAAGLSPRPADFTQHMVTGLHTDGQVFLWIKNGYPNSAMPAWDKRLTEDQIWQLVSYLRTFRPSNVPAKPAATPGSSTALPQPQVPASAQVPNSQEPLPALVSRVRAISGVAPSTALRRSRSPICKTVPMPSTQLLARQQQNRVYRDHAGADHATVPLPSSTLYVMNADGAELRAVWKPAQGLLGIPAWSADGQALYVAANGVKVGRAAAMARATFRSCGSTWRQARSSRCWVMRSTQRFSRDGKQLAYLKLSEDGYTMALNIAAPDGSASRQINDGKDFQGFYAPRFSPDGKQIIVAAIGGPEPTSRATR